MIPKGADRKFYTLPSPSKHYSVELMKSFYFGLSVLRWCWVLMMLDTQNKQ